MPQIPFELGLARAQRDAAWEMYGQAVDDGKPADAKERLYQAADCWDKLCQIYYDIWQAMGGTSDIQSIFLPRIVDGVSSPAWWRAQKAVPYDESL
jgi:hypothetical protein